jgi:ParB-like chromosome segregation protein Spo0J
MDQALTLVCGPAVDQLPDRFPVLHKITAQVNLSQETDPATLQTLAAIENLQRVDLTPLEKAEGFQSLLDGGLTLAEVVERTGEKASSIKRYLALLSLPEPVQEHFDKRRIPLDVLKELGQLPAEVQIQVAEKMAGRKSSEIKALVKMVQKRLSNSPRATPGNGLSTLPASETEGVSLGLDSTEVEANAIETRPASIREQLAGAKEIISKLTMQLHLDSRLLRTCAEELIACTPDSRVALMANARAEQIERSIKLRKRQPPVAQVQRGLKIERFMEKRQRGIRLRPEAQPEGRRDAQPG